MYFFPKKRLEASLNEVTLSHFINSANEYWGKDYGTPSNG
jgi:hypothetical protein